MMIVQSYRDRSLGWLRRYIAGKTIHRLAFYFVIACFLVLTTTGCTTTDAQDVTEPPKLAESTSESNAEVPSLEQPPAVSVPQLSIPEEANTATLPTTPQKNEQGNDGLSEEAQQRLVEAIANDLSQPEADVIIEAITQQTWHDGCLGLAKPDEFCTMALVEGWQVEIKSDGTSVTYRSNISGTVVRRAN